MRDNNPDVVTQYSKRNIIIATLVVLTVIIGFFLFKYFISRQTPQDAAEIAIKKVGELIELPKNEKPTVATVNDKSKLKDQVFFSNAENGDKVLIYSQAKKAILYRPSTNKIIEVAPINLEAKAPVVTISPTSIPRPTVSNKIKVAIYNGTKVSGLATTTEKQLLEKMPELEVVKKSDAKNDYSESLVIDLKGNNKALTEELAKFVSGKVAAFPEGEAAPEVSILIILGR